MSILGVLREEATDEHNHTTGGVAQFHDRNVKLLRTARASVDSAVVPDLADEPVDRLIFNFPYCYEIVARGEKVYMQTDTSEETDLESSFRSLAVGFICPLRRRLCCRLQSSVSS